MPDFDIIVIGAGPAGEVLAGRTAAAGLSTAIVEASASEIRRTGATRSAQSCCWRARSWLRFWPRRTHPARCMSAMRRRGTRAR